MSIISVNARIKIEALLNELLRNVFDAFQNESSIYFLVGKYYINWICMTPSIYTSQGSKVCWPTDFVV